MKDIDNFLKELTELSNKYGIYIEGCGCCGSPWISKGHELWDKDIIGKKLRYSEKNGYEVGGND